MTFYMKTDVRQLGSLSMRQSHFNEVIILYLLLLTVAFEVDFMIDIACNYPIMNGAFNLLSATAFIKIPKVSDTTFIRRRRLLEGGV